MLSWLEEHFPEFFQLRVSYLAVCCKMRKVDEGVTVSSEVY